MYLMDGLENLRSRCTRGATRASRRADWHGQAAATQPGAPFVAAGLQCRGELQRLH